MLSPEITYTKNLLADSYFQLQSVLGYAHTSNNLVVGFLKPDPNWLPSVRSRISLLSKAGNEMTLEYPNIWAPILVSFNNYIPLIKQLKGNLKNKNMASKQWIYLFKALENELNNCISTTKNSNEKLEERFNTFKDIQPLIAKSIDEGWDALSDEEEQMIKIVQALTHLQDKIANLESKLTTDAISEGSGAVKSTATIVYNIVTAATEVSIPFLSIAAVVFTIGKTFYDIISTSDTINKLITEIGDLKLEASQEAQALAGTKIVLQTLYNLELKFDALRDSLPCIEQMWVGELEKVKSAIDALESGVDPETFMEIQSLPMAIATWNEIENFVNKIAHYQFNIGPPVELNINKVI